MSRVSVNILNTNEMKYLPRCIASVSAQTYPDFRIVVIDNGSQDGSPEWVEQNHPEIQLIKNKKNAWYCGGHNIGIRETDSEFVLLLNSDVFIDPDFLEKAVQTIRSDDSIGGVQGKLWKIRSADAPIPPRDKRWIDTTGILMTASRRNFDRYQEQYDDGRFDTPGDVFGPDGSAPLYRREMLEDIQINGEYFDADFLIYRDVVDLSWRARSRGWKFKYNPEATGYHVRGFSPRTRKNQPLFFRKLSYRNRYLTLIKNETWPSLRRNLFRFLGFEAAMLGHVLLREPSLISAWFDLFALLPAALKKRRIIQANRKIPCEVITQSFQKHAPRLHFRQARTVPEDW